MSDSVSKWYDMQDDLTEGKVFKPYTKKFISEGHKKLAYAILTEYPEEAIIEAARILRDSE